MKTYSDLRRHPFFSGYIIPAAEGSFVLGLMALAYASIPES